MAGYPSQDNSREQGSYNVPSEGESTTSVRRLLRTTVPSFFKKARLLESATGALLAVACGLVNGRTLDERFSAGPLMQVMPMAVGEV